MNSEVTSVQVYDGEDTYRVDLEWIGEGVSGDYDPNDPADVPLLRFTISRNGAAMDDGSYCTQLPASLTTRQRVLVCENILRQVSGKPNVKKIGEWLSWLDERDVAILETLPLRVPERDHRFRTWFHDEES